MTEVRLFDADWAGSAPVPAFVASEGLLRASWTRLEVASPDPVASAADALAAVAAAAAAEAREAAAGGRVDVTGVGLVARLVRRLVDRPADDASSAPAVVVDAVGTSASVAAAVASVRRGGVVVLAGAPREEAGPIDLYPLHLGGVRLVAAPLPLEAPEAAVDPAAEVPAPVDVSDDGSPASGAAWCRLRV